LLRNDHARVKKLFTRFARTTERAARTRARLIEQIARELQVHTQIEEEIFYPAVEDVDALGPLVAESRREHRAVKRLLAQLRAMAPAGEATGTRVRDLRQVVIHHAIDEEEKRMFPALERELGADALNRLGAELRARKQSLQRGHRPAVGQAA